MPSFVPFGPVVPDELVQDLEDDRVVIFCGAGVSSGAGLPDFNGLVRDAYAAMGVTLPAKRDRQWTWPDRMLGSLEARSLPGIVRSRVATILGKPPTDVGLHRALLRLAKLSRHPGLRLVTTNFDTYFECADEALRPGIDLHSGPALPIPRDDQSASWRSVVYLHGRLAPPEHGNAHLIMTSADFGRAYLTDGWAARFVGQLFSDFSVLFVGYSLNDPVLRYMTDAFAAEAHAARRKSPRPPAYIFVSYQGKAIPPGALEDWRQRGLEPIFYNGGRHHRLLRQTIVAWADARDDWLSSTARLIARIAGTLPQSLTPSDVANLLWALFGRPQDDGYGVRVFADVKPSPSIDWLQIFEDHETKLLEDYQVILKQTYFAGGAEPSKPTLVLRVLAVGPNYSKPSLSKASLHLARWLASHLAEDAVIDWMIGFANSSRRPHPALCSMIRRSLSNPKSNLSAPKRRFWCLVSSDAPWMDGSSGAENIWNLPDLMRDLDNGGIFQVELLAAMRPFISFSPSNRRIDWARLMGVDDVGDKSEVDVHCFSRLAEAKIELIGGNQLRSVLKDVSKILDIDELLATMADELTSILKFALDLWALVQKADPDRDPSLYHQPSIVPHVQNRHFHHWTILIDLLWQAWCRIDKEDREASRRLVGRWRSIKYPTFQRMSLAAIGQSLYWSANEKLEALLNGL